MLALIDGKRTVAEILRVSPLSGFAAMRQLNSLSQRRIIRTVRRPPSGPIPRPPSPRVAGARLGLTQDLTAVADEFVEGKSESLPPRKVTLELAPVAATVIATRPMGRQLQTRPSLGPVAAQAVDLWFKLIRQDWSTLAVVPGHRLGSGVALACALSEVGSAVSRRGVELLSAEGHDLVPTTDWIFPRQENDQFQRVIALDPIAVNPMVIPVAQAAQAVLVVVEREAADLGAVRRTVEAIGRQHVTGCVLVGTPK
jgi:hypothetical protein